MNTDIWTIIDTGFIRSTPRSQPKNGKKNFDFFLLQA